MHFRTCDHTIASAMIVLVGVTAGAPSFAGSLRLFGNGTGDIDRVVIPLDAPPRPVDVGGDFTIELWIKAALEDNPKMPVLPGFERWIDGNILLDRDIFGPGDHGDYGASIAGGRVAFGVGAKGAPSNTVVGATNVANNAWRHVALSRRASDGRLRIWVDGQLDAEGFGPPGDISYRDGRTTIWPADPLLVIGAEKHDYDPIRYTSFSGFVDELRVSEIERYTADFARPTAPFATDQFTRALYHFDATNGALVADDSGHAGGPSHGELRVGGAPVGPIWSIESPFTAAPLAGDLNQDGAVDIFDVAIISNHWSEAGPIGDANHDGVVDIFDVAVVSNHWSPAASHTAPEPHGLALVAVMCATTACMASVSALRGRTGQTSGR